MQKLTASQAAANLARLMDQTAESHQPITIAGKQHDAVLLSFADWQAIQETLHLLSVTGMHGAIREGMNQPVAEGAKELDWPRATPVSGNPSLTAAPETAAAAHDRWFGDQVAMAINEADAPDAQWVSATAAKASWKKKRADLVKLAGGTV